MKNCLLSLAVVAALVVGAPAYSQYVFLDVNGDALNSNTSVALPDDVLGPTVHSVDVYFVTNKNRDGSTAVCGTAQPLSMVSYEFTLHASGTGTVTYGAWTDNLGFSFGLVTCGDGTICTAGPDVWVAKGTGTAVAPGKYKVGTLGITVTGTPRLDIVPGSPTLNSNSQTAFGSACDGVSFDTTIRLGSDFTDADGTESPTPVKATTWGKIKELYH